MSEPRLWLIDSFALIFSVSAARIRETASTSGEVLHV